MTSDGSSGINRCIFNYFSRFAKHTYILVGRRSDTIELLLVQSGGVPSKDISTKSYMQNK